MRYLLILALAFLASCGECPPKKEQTLRLNLNDDPVSFDPRLVRSLKDLTVVKQLYEGLTRKGCDALADSVSISGDLLTYTFKLKETRWSDGEPLTAYDFERSWKEALTPSFGSDYAYMLFPIKNSKKAWEGKCSLEQVGVKAIDETTLVVDLEIATPYFLELTAFPTYFPFKKEGVFSGPFAVKTWIPQSELILTQNPSYWDQENVKLAALSFTIINDNNTESQLFEKNKLDWLGQPTSNAISTEMLGIKKQLIESYPVAGTFWIKFNTAKAPFDRPEIRKAFAYAINRQEIIEHILQGDQKAATCPIPPSMQEIAHAHFEDGDVKEAQRLFEKAGWSGKIVLNYPPSERNAKIVQLVSQQWEKAFNIKVELEAVENHFYRRKLKEGDYQMGTGDWIADYNDPLAFLELFMGGSSINDTGWHNERFDHLVDQSRVDKNRSKILDEAEKILVDEMPIAPIYHYSFDYMKSDRVHDVYLSPLGIADFKYVSLHP